MFFCGGGGVQRSERASGRGLKIRATKGAAYFIAGVVNSCGFGQYGSRTTFSFNCLIDSASITRTLIKQISCSSTVPKFFHILSRSYWLFSATFLW